MKKITNNSGFTLIEIIVVLIIVGILAAIALPNLFGNIQKSKAAQALSQIDTYKTALEGCLTLNSGIAANASPCTLAGQNLATTLTNNGTTWTFSIPTSAQAQSGTLGVASAPAGSYSQGSLVYSIQASDGTNAIDLTRSTSGTWSCSTGTTSPYAGVC